MNTARPAQVLNHHTITVDMVNMTVADDTRSVSEYELSTSVMFLSNFRTICIISW